RQFGTQLAHYQQADSFQDILSGRRNHGSFADDQEISRRGFGNISVPIEQQGLAAWLYGLSLSLGKPPSHAAALLDVWVHALDWNVPGLRHNQVNTQLIEMAVSFHGQGKRVHAESGRTIADA